MTKTLPEIYAALSLREVNEMIYTALRTQINSLTMAGDSPQLQEHKRKYQAVAHHYKIVIEMDGDEPQAAHEILG